MRLTALIIAALLPIVAHAQEEQNAQAGLVGRWLVNGWQTGNGAVPTKAVDSSPFGNNGTVAGSATYSFFAPRGALSVNGSTQYVTVGDQSIYDFGTRNFTVTGWVQSSNKTNYQALVAKVAVYNEQGFNIVTEQTSGKLRALYDNTSPWTGGVYTFPSSPDLCDGKWHFFAVSFTYGGNMVGYVDGASVGTFSISTQTRGIDNARPLVFGQNSTVNGDKLTGKLSDIRIYNRALTAAEIKSIYEEGLK